MSFYSMFVSDHLNKIETGKPAQLYWNTSNERALARILADKNALALNCMGMGLLKMAEICSDTK